MTSIMVWPTDFRRYIRVYIVVKPSGGRARATSKTRTAAYCCSQLLKTALSNCRINGVNLFPTYREPFDLIFARAKTKEWRRERDSNPLFNGNSMICGATNGIFGYRKYYEDSVNGL